ncbi:MAG TPA: zf-TFIIB domain-containing protein [Croceibacterium sp.]|nr:zf-TFIIB domain-containing protein [Croceibacterium sp.]
MRNQEDVAAMQCPVCRTPLAMSDRQGIEIDYCPQCRGVWLDRGELDKIVERSAPQAAPAPAAPPPPQRQGRSWGGDDLAHGGHDRDDYQRGYGKPHKRRKSFLEELFD